MDEVSSLGRLILPFVRRQGRPKDCSASFSDPIMEGPGADSEEKHEPARDIDTAAVDSLKALDPERPIREATIGGTIRLPRRYAVLLTPKAPCQ